MPEQPATTVHRALADPGRARILGELETAGEPLDSAELGRRVGLHANTVRWHLAILADAGLVESRTLPRGAPGRPRRVYEPARAAPRPGAEGAVDEDEHRALAAALVAIAESRPDAAAAVELAGRSWGREVVAGEPPARGVAAVPRLVAVLDEHGFEAVAEGLEIEMHRCPFLDLARRSPEVVCGVHRGLLDGVLEELGSGLEVEALDVLRSPGVCVVRLAPREDAHRSPAP